ncbi:MAG: TIGR03915 family putative DNA repair protein, partial [Bacteroidota bacterium]
MLPQREAIEDHMLKALQYSFTENKNVLNDYGDPDVLVLKQTEKIMRRERHRMTAFVRFQLGTDQLYYSFIEPDFDVLPLLIEHFRGRYADQRWLIYDRKRHYGIYYDLQSIAYIRPSEDEISGI